MLYCIIKMNKIRKQVLIPSIVVSSFALSILSSKQANAVETAILPDTDIAGLLNIVLVVLTTGVGIAATVAFVAAGIMYSTAAGNAAQVQKAKTMILNTVIGLLSYLLMWAFINWLVPGGVI
jgi:hypothetical protein